MLKFCLVVDAEKFISFKQGNPRWSNFEKLKGKINNAVKKFRYNENGFEILYKTALKESFPVSFMLVGKLFAPINSPNFIEWGYHTYNHIPLTLINDDSAKKEIKNIYKTKSFSPPLWMVEDSKNPDRIFKMLENEEYKNVIYKGLDRGLLHEHHFEISPPKKRGKLKLIHVSNTFEGNSSNEHIKKLFKDMLSNLNKNAVYCLCTHDFTHKNSRNFLRLASFLKRLEEENKIKITNIKNV